MVIVVVGFGVVSYIICVGVSSTTVGRLSVYCWDCRDVVVLWPTLCIAGFMVSLTRIAPTWVVVVGTGVIRFLVSLQKNRVTYPVPRWLVAINRVHTVLVCYFATILLICLHGLLLVCNSSLPSSTPGSYSL